MERAVEAAPASLAQAGVTEAGVVDRARLAQAMLGAKAEAAGFWGPRALAAEVEAVEAAPAALPLW